MALPFKALQNQKKIFYIKCKREYYKRDEKRIKNYNYNEKGMLIEMIEYFIVHYITTIITKIIDENTIEYVSFDTKGKINEKHTQKFDSRNNLIEHVHYCTYDLPPLFYKGEIIHKFLLFYDEDDNVIEEKLYNGKKEVKRTKFEYIFDLNGNWTLCKKTSARVSADNQADSFSCIETIERDIDYY